MPRRKKKKIGRPKGSKNKVKRKKRRAHRAAQIIKPVKRRKRRTAAKQVARRGPQGATDMVLLAELAGRVIGTMSQLALVLDTGLKGIITALDVVSETLVSDKELIQRAGLAAARVGEVLKVPPDLADKLANAHEPQS